MTVKGKMVDFFWNTACCLGDRWDQSERKKELIFTGFSVGLLALLLGFANFGRQHDVAHVSPEMIKHVSERIILPAPAPVKEETQSQVTELGPIVESTVPARSIAEPQVTSAFVQEPILSLRELLEPSVVETKSRLTMPSPAPTLTLSPAPRTYTMKSGDTPGGIAKMHNISVKALMDANKIQNPKKLRDGTVLNIPEPKPMTEIAKQFPSTSVESIIPRVETGNVEPSVVDTPKNTVVETPPAPLPLNAEDQVRQGLGEWKAGNTTAALTAFQRATELDPSNFTAYYNWGTLLSESGNLHDAVRILTLAASLRPESPETYYNLGHSYYKLGNRESAINNLRQYMRLARKNPAQHARLRRVRNFLFHLEIGR